MLLARMSGFPSPELVTVKATTGNNRILNLNYAGNNNFPGTVGHSVQLSVAQGIWLGSGTTPPTEMDYNLESRITSGLAVSGTVVTYDADQNGNPYLVYLFSLTNTSSSTITISEIGYVQQMSGSGYGSDSYILLDRTVLENPITIEPGEDAAVKYELKAILPT
jgi:hypothetical protein